MTSVSAGHIILTPTQPVGIGRPQRESNPGPPHHESRALPTELPRPPRERERERERETETEREGGIGRGRKRERERERERDREREREREMEKLTDTKTRVTDNKAITVVYQTDVLMLTSNIFLLLFRS